MLEAGNRKQVGGAALLRVVKKIKRIPLNRETFAVSVTVLMIAVAIIVTIACQVKVSSAIITDGVSRYEIYTTHNDTDKIVAEQKSKLHPFDMITYAGYNGEGDFEIVIERAPTITISDNGKTVTARAKKGENVSSMLVREKFDVKAEDAVVPSPEYVIDGNMNVSITRAFPVSIVADGEVRRIKAAGLTVSELLERENIVLSEYDEVSVPLNMEVYENMEIFVSRIEYCNTTKRDVFPHNTIRRENQLLQIGTEVVVKEGRDGESTVTTTEKYVNGIKLGTYVSDTSYIEPITEIIEYGTAKSVPISKKVGDFKLVDGVPTEYDYIVSGKVTAYTARSGCGTYSGRPLEVGSIAVVPDVIPFGSEVYIVSKDGTHVYGYAIASDTGDLKEANVVADVFMGLTEEHYKDACAWGAQFCDVYVITTGDNSVSWRD